MPDPTLDLAVQVRPPRPGPPAAVVRPSRRRRRRPGDHRRRDPGAGGAGAGADRDRDRAARGVRRAGAPALRAGGPARAVDREHARAPSTPATAARSRCCWSTSTRASRSSCAAATGSPSWSSSGSSRPAFVEVEALPDRVRGDGRLRFYRRLRPTADPAPSTQRGVHVKFRRKAQPTPSTTTAVDDLGRGRGRDAEAAGRRPVRRPTTCPDDERRAGRPRLAAGRARAGPRAAAPGRRGQPGRCSRWCSPARTARSSCGRSRRRATATSGARSGRRSPPRSPRRGGTATEREGRCGHRAGLPGARSSAGRQHRHPAVADHRHQRPALAAARHAARPAGRRARRRRGLGGRASREVVVRRGDPRDAGGRAAAASTLPAAGPTALDQPTTPRRHGARRAGCGAPSAAGPTPPTRTRATCAGRTREAGVCDLDRRRARPRAGAAARHAADRHAAPARRRTGPRGRALRRLRRRSPWSGWAGAGSPGSRPAGRSRSRAGSACTTATGSCTTRATS